MYVLVITRAKPSLGPELRSCVKVQVAVLGFPSLTLAVLMVSVDIKLQ